VQVKPGQMNLNLEVSLQFKTVLIKGALKTAFRPPKPLRLEVMSKQ
jgi:hypothetical protein